MNHLVLQRRSGPKEVNWGTRAKKESMLLGNGSKQDSSRNRNRAGNRQVGNVNGIHKMLGGWYMREFVSPRGRVSSLCVYEQPSRMVINRNQKFWIRRTKGNKGKCRRKG